MNSKYSVDPILPENQVDKNAAYFSMRMMPSKHQNIVLVVHNSDSKDLDLMLEPHNASTNNNGVIVYNKDIPVDSSMKIPFTEIISKKQEVHLKPKESKSVVFSLKMPKEKFDGMILGGFRIYEKENGHLEKTQSVQIRNKIEYEISVKLTETDAVIAPNINLVDVYPGLDNFKTAIFTKLQNESATVIENLTVNTKIYIRSYRCHL